MAVLLVAVSCLGMWSDAQMFGKWRMRLLRRHVSEATDKGSRRRRPLGWGSGGRLAATIILSFGYVVAMDYLGYFLASWVFLMGILWLSGETPKPSARTLGRYIAIATLLVGGSYLLFERGLNAFLPRGKLAGY